MEVNINIFTVIILIFSLYFTSISFSFPIRYGIIGSDDVLLVVHTSSLIHKSNKTCNIDPMIIHATTTFLDFLKSFLKSSDLSLSAIIIAHIVLLYIVKPNHLISKKVKVNLKSLLGPSHVLSPIHPTNQIV